ncbi:MAG TPA: CBS domain-containing protein [Myxococcales bacterium]|nr:CBS domain-containing protein [Myxococcales bacterium]
MATQHVEQFGGGAKQMGRMLALYGLLGILAGLAAAAFAWMIDISGEFLVGTLSGAFSSVQGQQISPFELSMPHGGRWLLLVIPAAGGLLSGLICAKLAPEAMGAGTNQSIDAYHNHGGFVRTRVPWVKSIASTLTLGSGGSGGVEGPIAQISAGFGSVLSRRFNLSAKEQRVLMMAGFAAGIGAVFHAPMAAAIFAAEVLYSEMDLEHEILVPAIIASTVSYGVYSAIRGWEALFELPPVGFEKGLQLLPYLGLAVILSVAAIIFMLLFKTIRTRLGRSSSLPLWARPALGGLAVGFIGLWIPPAMGAGYDIIVTALHGHVGVVLLIILAVAKMLTSALTVGSGGASGLFAPSLVIGGALGGAVGLLATDLWPSLEITRAAFVVVGMAGFFAAVGKAPISTVIMVAEIAGNYRLIVPTLWVCVLTWLLTRHQLLYTEQIPTRLDAPARLSDMMGAVLHRIRVRDTQSTTRQKIIMVSPKTPLRDLVNHFAHTSQSVFPITAPTNDSLLGVVDGRQLRRTIGERGVDTLLIANDFQMPAITITPDDTLHEAITRMTASGFDELVVVDSESTDQVLGIISRRMVITAYHRRMLDQTPDTESPQSESGLFRPETIGRLGLAKAMERGGMIKGLKADSPTDVLKQIIEQADLPGECDRAQLLSLLLEREQLGSTGVGDGIAVPHPHAEHLAGISEARVIIATLKTPIDWTAYDGKPVDTICVLLCESGSTHLSLLGELARSLTDPVIRKALSKRASLKQLLSLITKDSSSG